VKIQDIGFIIVLALLFAVRKPIWFVYAGIVSWILAIPLFAGWIFFTAERLTWYGAAFILTYLLISHEK
jgi:hypothetical protein